MVQEEMTQRERELLLTVERRRADKVRREEPDENTPNES